MLTKFTQDIAYNQKQVDEPNDVGGLTADEFKALLDQGALDTQNYINNTLTQEIDTEFTNIKGVGYAGETIKGVKQALDSHKTGGDHDNRYYKATDADNIFVSKNDLTINRKLSASGDFTGTWNGIPFSQTDPGTQAIVQQHTSQLSNIVTYDITKNSLFNANNISLAIADVVSKMNPGDTAILTGSYNVSSQILVSGLKVGTKLILKCVFDCAPGITEPIKLLNCTNATIEFNSIVCTQQAGQPNAGFTNTGLVISNCYNCDISVRYLEAFYNGIKVKGEGLNGSQYNRITWQYLKNCFNLVNIAVDEITQADKTAGKGNWVNENTFYGGRIYGTNGVVFSTATLRTDLYNNNKFYNIGFEQLTGDAIKLSQAQYNVFYSPRFEAITGQVVNEDNTCNTNTFFVQFPVMFSKLTLNGKCTMYNGILQESGGQIIADKYYSPGYQQSTNTEYVMSGENVTAYYTNTFGWRYGNTSPFSQFLGYVNKGGTVIGVAPVYETKTKALANQNLTMQYLYKQLHITSDTAAVTVTIPNAFKYDGAEFYVSTNWVVNTITFVDEGGATQFTITSTDGNGTYRALYASSRGQFTKIKISTNWHAI